MGRGARAPPALDNVAVGENQPIGRNDEAAAAAGPLSIAAQNIETHDAGRNRLGDIDKQA